MIGIQAWISRKNNLKKCKVSLTFLCINKCHLSAALLIYVFSILPGTPAKNQWLFPWFYAHFFLHIFMLFMVIYIFYAFYVLTFPVYFIPHNGPHIRNLKLRSLPKLGVNVTITEKSQHANYQRIRSMELLSYFMVCHVMLFYDLMPAWDNPFM